MEKTKKRVVVLLGGQSTEHDVSLISGLNVFKAIPREKYDVNMVKITREGQWLWVDQPQSVSAHALKSVQGIRVLPGQADASGFFKLHEDDARMTVQLEAVDVVFPVLHGPNGEDGSVQGLLQAAGLPYAGCGVAASAAAMDKVLAKQLFFQNDLNTADFLWFLRTDWQQNAALIRTGVASEIGYPCFVKPANAGSSVGVSKVHAENELEKAVNKAVEFDRKILIEKAVDAREIECAVMGNDQPLASIAGEVIPAHEFYDYEAKYHNKDSQLNIPAEIDSELEKKIQKEAIAAYKALDCSGMARVDFLLEKGSEEIYVNEINTIPGFTSISMYTKLWEASGVSCAELLDRLIQLALLRHEDLNRSKTVYETET